MEKSALNYPSDLPVCEHRAEILAALRGNQVVIVCGDTGSGKTTQLPKMALEARSDRHGATRIACTQPRRLAAVTMAERVADELKCEVGGLVGFRHRFGRKMSSETRIEFMTDGVLLAETRFDPLLRAYNTIIVDEAHERSLNIDFLLGILKRILKHRRDLKIIISSATLDSARFSAFFDNAPAIIVPGRLFPIEIGYRPPPDGEERDLPRDIAEAIAELPAKDDVLVFLPGERDIRETADYLADARGGFDDIIPLLASLPAAEQRRAFRLSPRRRIILATNVAETSVTIPGIRAVIDSGLARISRYIHRTQIQRLQIEPISQASAKQRTGRCGRVGPGTCLRLYSEEDFNSRDAYTPPEILRSSLAGVILTMLDLRLGSIENFPFIDPPKPTMIREGLRELLELGAIKREESPSGDKGIALTDIGRKLAKIPVEPRLARMLIAASQNAVLPSVLPIVAAMSCDDPRRRPIDEREKADQAHARFRVQNSDFLGTLKLWQWWENETKDLSQSKARKLCKTTYLSYPKMREWRDLTRQLETLSKRLGLSFITVKGQKDEDFSAAFHRALLSGLLGRIGKFDEEERTYRGAHGLRFAIHPGSVLAKAFKKNCRGQQKPSFPQWIAAGELVDTERLYARCAAIIDVRWLEPIAGSICKHSYHSPEWDESSGFVRATEQVTLYGLVIVPSRRCDFSRINPPLAREIFIRRGLIDCDFPRPPPHVRSNIQFLDALRKYAERSRTPEAFDADRLFAHFNRIIPADICSADAMRKWKPADGFILKSSDWWPRKSATTRDFPDSLRIAGTTISLSYHHTPDDPENDGITCTIRQSDANVLKLWQSDWLVPGLLPAKVSWMLNSLPSAIRRPLSPIGDAVAILLPMLKPGKGSLEQSVRAAVLERWSVRIPENIWDWKKLPAHLQMRYCIRDNKNGKAIIASRDLKEVLSKIRPQGNASANSRDTTSSEHFTTWMFGTIPTKSVDRNSGWETTSYPALVDVGDGVIVKLFADQRKASEAHASGVTRLLTLAMAKSTAIPFRGNRIDIGAAIYLKSIGYSDEKVATDILAGAVREALVRGRTEIRSAEEFAARLKEGRSEVVRVQSEITRIIIESSATANKLFGMLEDERLTEESRESISTQISWLLFPGFPKHVPLVTLRQYARYLRGAQIRIERARLSPSSDMKKESLFSPYWIRYQEALKNMATVNAATLSEFRWMLEEYRVSVFAQELHTPEPISPKRLEAKWEEATLMR